MVRKSADNLAKLTDNMEEKNQNQKPINISEVLEQSHKSDINNNISTEIPRGDISPDRDDADLTAQVEIGGEIEDSVFDSSESRNSAQTKKLTKNLGLERFEESNNSDGNDKNKTLKTSRIDSISPEDNLDLTVQVKNEKKVQAAMDKKKKPRLFLHVGPQKTGSTTLQSMLDKLSVLTGELKGDNIYLRHVSPQEGDFDCDIDEWGTFRNCKASDALKTLIQKAKNEGKNLLLTDENLDRDFVAGLRDAIDDKDWDVTVIVMYRRIHEWLVSWYNQINKTTNKDSNGNILFDKEGLPYRTERRKWPDQGGTHITSFSSWYEQYIHYWKPTELVNQHRSIEYYNLYNESFENVLLYNLHQEEEEAVTNIICNIIGATHACEKIRSREVRLKKNNRSVQLDHDILSVYAYDQGYIAKALKRKEVVEAVTKFIQKSGKVLPRKCDLKMTNQIRNWLVDTEKVVVGDQNWSNTKKEELLQLYESFVKKGKICDVDKEAVLQDGEWLQFFHSLGKQNRQDIVLHVGPIGGKTIYDALTTMSGEGEELLQDNYALLDISEHDHFDCTSNGCNASPTLKSVIFSLEEAKKNLIIVDDNLDERFVEAFKEVFDQKKWNLKIVVGYVRLEQLLLMTYDNEYDYENLDPNALMSIGQNKYPNRDKYSAWPEEGGISIPGFNVWFDVFAQDAFIEKIKQVSMHLRDAYISSFDDIDFFAYHQRHDLVKDFVCKIVPGATQSCTALTASEQTNKKTLESDYSESDILAIRAHEKGLVKKELTREAVRDAIREKLRSTKKVLSRTCDSKISKQLYDWMIESEKAILGDKFTSKRIAWINQDFQYFMESGKLCALDIEKELQDEMWVNYFNNNPQLLPDRDAIA